MNGSMKIQSPTDASIILTYRCPMRCKMCGIWKSPTDAREEITAADLRSLPRLKFINLTGGEPFIREDLSEIINECYRHAPRIVISTSGWFDNRVIKIAEKFPEIGIRISIEGLNEVNDELRGRIGGFEKGYGLLLKLKEMGLKDIGFGCTVSDRNSSDMLRLYELSRSLGVEFATAATHNSFYFHKDDNILTNQDKICDDFEELVRRQLKEKNPKSWFRAYFNMGLMNYVRGNRRLLPCEAGSMNFFIDPWGEVLPCNGMEDKYWKLSMGNIRSQSFEEIWNSERAQEVRRHVSACAKNCWMIGTASPVMHRYISVPMKWVIRNKMRSMLGLKLCLENHNPKTPER